MARNNLVNKWAEDIRRNMDRESTGIRICALDTNTDGVLGRILIKVSDCMISFNVTDDNEYGVRLRVFGCSGANHRTKIRNAIDSVGYASHQHGNVTRTNLAFNRVRIARLAVALAA